MSDKEALNAADTLLTELQGGSFKRDPSPAPTMGRLQKVSYSHEAMIDLIIKSEGRMTQNELAAYFGYTPGWISNILASDAFQAAMAQRRDEIIDPVIRASIKERLDALVHQSLTVLMHKLSAPQVSDTVALRALELGVRARGDGGFAPPKPTEGDRLERLANRLIDLQGRARHERTVDETTVIEGKLLPQG